MLILSLDGGGIRGLIAATVLENLEADTGKLTREIFEGVAGTSTGGIIACAVAAGIPMSKIKALYKDKAEVIFTSGFLKELESVGGLTDEKYNPEGLEDCLLDLFGDAKLSQSPIRLLVPACDLAGQPVLFRSESAKQDLMFDFFLRDVCRATSAAPTFFPPAKIKSMAGTASFPLMDGGLAANQPAMCAIIDAMGRAALPNITLVSLGTGWTPEVRTLNEAENCGLLSGGAPLLRIMFSGPGYITDWQCSTLLGMNGYIRLQPVLPSPIEMDTTEEKDLATLELLGNSLCESSDYHRLVAMAKGE